jgi:hypothetical protein
MAETLDARSETHVRDAIAALESTAAPLERDDWPALRDRNLSRVVDERLGLVGRRLVTDEHGRVISGYRDDVADTLLDAGGQTLAEDDLAVLTLVLIHTVAIPHAAGEIDGRGWDRAVPVRSQDLRDLRHDTALSEARINESLRRLRDAGILAHGMNRTPQPGPQMLRLTERRSRAVWERLVRLADPEGLAALWDLDATPDTDDEEQHDGG